MAATSGLLDMQIRYLVRALWPGGANWPKLATLLLLISRPVAHCSPVARSNTFAARPLLSST